MSQPSKAQRIVDQILNDERYTQSRVFSDRVYRDEPIVRTGAQAYAKRESSVGHDSSAKREVRAGRETSVGYDSSAKRANQARAKWETSSKREVPPKRQAPARQASDARAQNAARQTSMDLGDERMAVDVPVPINARSREGERMAVDVPVPSAKKPRDEGSSFSDAAIPSAERSRDATPRDEERVPFLRAIAPGLTNAARAVERHVMPPKYRKMRALARAGASRAHTYAGGASRIFCAQAKYMEDFEDDFEGSCDYLQYFPTYEDMSNYQLRCYFSWRTRLRKGEVPPAPAAFLFLHAYELICGIGSKTGKEGYDELRGFHELYAGTSQPFDVHMQRWIHDYAIYYDVDPDKVASLGGTDIVESVSLLRRAETVLLSQKYAAWPDKPTAELPDPASLLDALCKLSRYRAEKSRFIRDHRDDAAWVVAHVFARMVDHCHKRRKTDYVDGLFGMSTLTSYTMFPSAIFFSERPHGDTTYVLSPSETYVCERGFWWRKLPCRKVETNRELGALMHAIDARMRKAMGDKHPLKEKSLPKYQGKFVDEEIQALIDARAAQEAARVRIDLSALESIRSAAVRTREALLTDDELEDEVAPDVGAAAGVGVAPGAKTVPNVGAAPSVGETPTAPATSGVGTPVIAATTPGAREKPAATSPLSTQVDVEPGDGTSSSAGSVLGLDEQQMALLQALLAGEPTTGFDALFLSLAVDAINDAFLDVVGDTVIEFDDDVPQLVEDYVDDVRDALD